MTHKKLSGMFIIGLLASAGAVWAATDYSISATLDRTGLLEIQTSPMDKGWFNTGNTLDRTKSYIVTTYTVGATSCSDAVAGETLSSATSGTFIPIYNTPGRNVTGYYWDIIVDLSGSQNHWYNHTHCDGTVEVHGCAEASPVFITSTVTGPSDNCRTLDRGSCATATTGAKLPAVQDPDVIETNCGGTCDIGTCVSACESDCNDAWPVGGIGNAGNAALKAACNAECHCTCKEAEPYCTIGVGECDD
jgi:hypothetical protein